MHHLLAVSLLWLGVFQTFFLCLMASGVGMVGTGVTNRTSKNVSDKCLQGIHTFGVVQFS